MEGKLEQFLKNLNFLVRFSRVIKKTCKIREKMGELFPFHFFSRLIIWVFSQNISKCIIWMVAEGECQGSSMANQSPSPV